MSPSAIAGALVAWAGITVAEGAALPLWATIAGYAITTAALSAASYGLGRLFQQRAPTFEARAQERLHVIRSAVAPRRVAYGESMISGVLVFHRSMPGPEGQDQVNYYDLFVFDDTEAGASKIVLYADQAWRTEDINLVISQGSTFTISGDAQTYETTQEATAVPDNEGYRYKIELNITPVLQQDAAADTATTLQLQESISGEPAKKHEYFYMVLAHCDGPIQEIKDIYFNDKIPHEIDITESIASISANISSSSAANPTVITTAADHGLLTGDWIKIENHTGSIPSLNGIHQVTRLGKTTFSIPVEVTTGGTGGSLYRLCQVRTPRPHSYCNDDEIWIQNHTGSNPDINGAAIDKQTVYRVDAYRYAIDVNLTTGGTGGTCYPPRFYDGATPLFRIDKHLGAADQAADANLLAEIPEWNANRRLRGIAYTSLRLKFSYKAYPTGIPNIKVLLYGKNDVYDPRVPGSGYTRNWALCAYDALKHRFTIAAPDAEIDEDNVIAEANICDEPIDLFPAYDPGTGYTAGAFAVDAGIVYECVEPCTGVQPPNTVYWRRRYDLSPTQPRYTCDGMFSAESDPREILSAIATAGAAKLPVFSQGKWRWFCGSYRTPDLPINEDDLRSKLQVRPRIQRSDLFNAVRGVYTDPAKSWQPTDFPAVHNPYYSAQDDGGKVYKAAWSGATTYSLDDIVEESGVYYISLQDNNLNHQPPDPTWWAVYSFKHIYRDIELPFTTDSIRAQRLAKIVLEKSRQGITVVWPGKLTVFPVMPLDTVQVSVSALGWSAKPFQVISRTLTKDFGVDLELQEEADACYDWAYGDATVEDPAPDTDLPRPYVVPAPANLTLTERLYKDGRQYQSKIVATWDGPADYSIKEYVVEAALQGSDVWYSCGPPTIQTRMEIPSVPRGQYTIRVKAVNLYQCSSDWTSADITVFGMNPILASAGLAPPIQPKLFYTPDKYGHVNKVRFQCQYKVGVGGIPTGILLLYSISDYPNMLTLGTDSGATIDIAGGAVIDQGEYDGDILAGSTRSRLILRTETNPFSTDFDRAGMFWFQYGSSQWRKASGYDELGVDFRIPFDVDPTPGQKLNYIMIGWIDDRDPDNRLLFVKDAGGGYEVIKWGAVEQAGNTFRLTGCSRGQEGTTQMDVSGLDAQYYPWIGPGTAFINFPLDSFSEVGKGIYEANADAGFNWLPQFWSSFACLAYIETDGGYIRSYIVPAQRGGGL